MENVLSWKKWCESSYHANTKWDATLLEECSHNIRHISTQVTSVLQNVHQVAKNDIAQFRCVLLYKCRLVGHLSFLRLHSRIQKRIIDRKDATIQRIVQHQEPRQIENSSTTPSHLRECLYKPLPC